MTLDQLLDILEGHAHQMLLTLRHPELTPLYHICAPEGPDLVIGCPWRDEQEKLIALQLIREKARELHATAIGFISEVWFKRINDPLVDLDKVERPSQSADREEGVLAVVTDGHETKSRAWQIVRDRPGGAIIHLQQDDPGTAQLSGRMIDGLLPKPTVH
jgi:hypothetical protein